MNENMIAGRYEVIEQIDSGGTSYVYRATDQKTGETAALKVLRPESASDPEAVDRFKKEVATALRLRHANIIRSYDAGKDGDKYYIAMDFINGKTLKHIININEPLPPKFVVNVTKKLCLALEYAHVKGFVHRDVKPQNIMIDMDGEPYITDFGIAHRVNQNSSTVEDEAVMGSVHYFSPEQAKGEKVDKRTDIYSLGIVLYEMLTGKLPFDGETSVGIALKHINEEMPDVCAAKAGIPKSLSRIIAKATQKDKNLRYKSAFAMYEDLCRCLSEPDGEYIKLPENAEMREAESAKAAKSHFVMKTIVVISLVLAGVLAGVVLVFNMDFMTNANFVEVPQLIGETEQSAVNLVTSMGLVPAVIYDYNGDISSGIVMSQEPASGENVKEAETITILVSQGPEMLFMPEVTGITLEEAKTRLGEAGVANYEIIEDAEAAAPDGYVTAQMPEADTQIGADETVVITVKTSAATAAQTAPGITDMPLSDGLELLSASGFTKIYVYEDNSTGVEGLITGQTPSSGVTQSADSPFTLWINSFGNVYEGNQALNVAVKDDGIYLRVAVKVNISGVDSYFMVYESQENEGNVSLDIPISIGLPFEDAQIDCETVVFINDTVEEKFASILALRGQ